MAYTTYVVDTHALVWHLEGDSRLGPAAQAALNDGSVKKVIPTIVLAEIAFLYSRRRVATDVSMVSSHVAAASDCVIYPLDEIVISHLPTALNIHDAIIVATAIVFRDVLGETTSLITKDSDIAASGLIPVVWS
jgi:predicted nucleic acid-binding protein